MSTKRSRVYPPYKTKYRVTNGASYNETLVRRGHLRLWISAGRKRSFRVIANWNAKPSKRRRGGQPKYSNRAIETALTLRLVYHLPLRQTEEFVTSIEESISQAHRTDWSPMLETRGRISQAVQSRECLLQIQIDDRRPTSIQGSGLPENRSDPRLQHPQSDVRVRSPEVRRDQGLKPALHPIGWLEIDSCSNAQPTRPRALARDERSVDPGDTVARQVADFILDLDRPNSRTPRGQ
jgi:hypothetical protein